MTIQKPYSGVFAYEGIIPSQVMNNINNDLANVLDKTGETAAEGGGVSGEIEFLSGSSLVLDSGSTLVLNSGFLVNGNIEFISSDMSPKLFQQTPSTDISPGNITIQAANAYSSALVNTSGGSLTIETGNGVGSGTLGQLSLYVGNGADGYAVLVAAQQLTELFGGQSTPNMVLANGTIIPEVSIVFGSAVSSPTISQSNTSGLATSLTVRAQQTTDSGQTGGSLILSSGIGPGSNGNVNIQSGGTNNIVVEPTTILIFPVSSTVSLQINPWVGSVNTQWGINTLSPFLCNTSASGSNATFGTIAIPNSTTMTVKINWVRRNSTGGGTGWGNEAILIANTNSSGSVTVNTLTTLVSSGGAFDAGSVISVATGTRSIILSAVAQTAAMDWQFIVSVNQI